MPDQTPPNNDQTTQVAQTPAPVAPQPTIVVQTPTMNDRISSLWENNKLLFFVALPVIIIVIAVLVGRDLLMSYLVGSARKETEAAQKQDSALQQQIAQQQQQASEAEAKASDDQKKIDNRNETDIPDDWNKKQ